MIGRWDPSRLASLDHRPVSLDRVARRVLIVTGLVIAAWWIYDAGRAREAQLALDAYDTARAHRDMTQRLLVAGEYALHVVAQTDSALLDRLQAVPYFAPRRCVVAEDGP